MISMLALVSKTSVMDMMSVELAHVEILEEAVLAALRRLRPEK